MVHTAHTAQGEALPSRPPHPAGVSQQLWAGGAAGLGALPAEKGTPSLPREGKRGDILGQREEGNKFQFQTALTFGLGLPNRLVLLHLQGRGLP